MRDLFEFMKVNRRLLSAVVVAIGLLLALQTYIKTGADECLGVADSKETMISFETPVIVKRIFVLPGQHVKKGQPLVEVVPAEVNLKLLEVQTELESLESEEKVRNVLLNSVLSKKSKLSDGSPLNQMIAGLRRQAEELKRQQALAVRYAEEDGVVATVAYRPKEQVQPFLPIITLIPHKPDLVYGFIHENRASDYRLGDVVKVESIADRNRSSLGKIVSMGSRITAFPERFQIQPMRPTYFGRELIIRLPDDNKILIGEKVRVAGVVRSRNPELDFLAVADASSTLSETQVRSEVVSRNLNLEAGGAVFLSEANSLLLVSDDDGPQKSPFWILSLEPGAEVKNLSLSGTKKIDDVEAVSLNQDGQYYATSSLSKDKNGNEKASRNGVVRFSLQGDVVVVDRHLDLRTPMIASLKNLAMLSPISESLEDLEVEAFSTFGNDAFVSLKQPQMPDGSSVILKINNFISQVQNNDLSSINVDIYSIVRLEDQRCANPSRVVDLVKTEKGLMVLSNCKKSEKTGQIWYMADQDPTPSPSLLFTLQNGQPEGLGFGPNPTVLYVASDNGNVKKKKNDEVSEKKAGSDILRVSIPPQK